MKPSGNRTRIQTASVAVLAMFAAVAIWAIAVPAAASAGSVPARIAPTAGSQALTIVVPPSGGDDTPIIQAAFNACVGYGHDCTVKLMKGTYTIGQIAVTGFTGNFIGAGQGLTVLQAKKNLPSPNPKFDTATTPFWAAAPGTTNPWPVLLTFVGGSLHMSGMTVSEQNAVPDRGWSYFGFPYTALVSVIYVTGTTASAWFNHVAVLSGPGTVTFQGPGSPTFRFNALAGITYEGALLPVGWSNPLLDQTPVSGTFSVTNSLVVGTTSAVWVQNTLTATVAVSNNRFDGSPGPGFADIANTQMTWSANRMTNVMIEAGVMGFQGLSKLVTQPSTVYVVGNEIHTEWYASGITFADYGPMNGGASTITAIVKNNVVVADNSCGCFGTNTQWTMVSSALVSSIWEGNQVSGGGVGFMVDNQAGGVGTGAVVIAHNEVVGAYVGITSNAANRVSILGNVVLNSVTYGIVVSGNSNHNVISQNVVQSSGQFDLYWDLTGVGNVWVGNQFVTAHPPTLH